MWRCRRPISSRGQWFKFPVAQLPAVRVPVPHRAPGARRVVVAPQVPLAPMARRPAARRGRIAPPRSCRCRRTILAISGDDQYLYVALDGSSSVQRFLLPGLTPDISYSLGRSDVVGALDALSLQVAPGARTRWPWRWIYDDATARPTFATSGAPGSLQWGSDASTLYAANNSTTGFDLYTYAVSSSGLLEPRVDG
jgi:hypothetical protein